MIASNIIFYFFFFQAEDGIRDKLVTGVQTCALPIFQRCPDGRPRRSCRSTDSLERKHHRCGPEPDQFEARISAARVGSLPRVSETAQSKTCQKTFCHSP